MIGNKAYAARDHHLDAWLLPAKRTPLFSGSWLKELPTQGFQLPIDLNGAEIRAKKLPGFA